MRPTELVAVFVILGNAVEVVESVAGIERGIAVVPEQAAAELIGS